MLHSQKYYAEMQYSQEYYTEKCDFVEGRAHSQMEKRLHKVKKAECTTTSNPSWAASHSLLRPGALCTSVLSPSILRGPALLPFRDFFRLSPLQSLCKCCFLCLYHSFPTSLPSGFKSQLKCHFLKETLSYIPNEATVKCFHDSLQFSILILLILVIVNSVGNQIRRAFYMQG